MQSANDCSELIEGDKKPTVRRLSRNTVFLCNKVHLSPESNYPPLNTETVLML